MNPFLRTLTGGFLTILITSVGTAGTIYVDGTIPGAGDGSKETPFKTIYQATDASSQGDVILIKRGIYEENVTESDDYVTISAWGEDMPIIRAKTPEKYVLNLSGFKITITGLEIQGGNGVSLVGDYSTVRDCIFNKCEQALFVTGHYNIIIDNEIRNSSKTTPGGLFHIIGAGNYTGNNYFHNNSCPESSAILCQGFGAKVINNLIYCDKQGELGYGITTTTTGDKSLFTSCENQEISYNRIWGYVKYAFIQTEGDPQKNTEILHNTLVGTKDKVATGLKTIKSMGSLIIQRNLIGNMRVGIDFEGTIHPNCDYNNLFSNLENTKSIGKVTLSPGKNDTSIEPKFHSVDPNVLGFLHPVSSIPVVRTKQPEDFRGARPAYCPPISGNVAYGKPCLGFPFPLGKISGLSLILTDGYQGKRLTLRKEGIEYVLLDLKKEEPVESVIMYASKVRMIEVFVSDDDLVYYSIGTVEEVTEQSGDSLVFALRGLRTRGRYVLIKLMSSLGCPEISEIEVLKGKHDPHSISITGNGYLRPEMIPPEYKYKEVDDVPHDIYRLYRERFSMLKGNMAKAKKVSQDINGLKKADALLDSLDKKLSLEGIIEVKGTPKPKLRAMFPREMSNVNGRILPLLFKDHGGYILSNSNPYEELNTLALPSGNTSDVSTVSISACMNETEPGAFLITNTTEKDLNFSIDISLPVNEKGEKIPLTQIMLRHPIERLQRYGRTTASDEVFLNFIYVSDVLVKLDHGEGNRLSIPVGETHQVWVLVDTSNVPAGTYKGKLTISSEGLPTKGIDLIIRVHDVDIPGRTSLKTYSFLYIGNDRFMRDLAYTVNDLVSHKMNTIIEHSFVPWPDNGSFDKDGHLIKPINYNVLDMRKDKLGKDFDYFNFHVFHFAFKEYQDKRKLMQDDLEFGSERWQTALREWVNDWAMHMEKVRGISTDQFALYIYDEPVAGQIDDFIVRVGKVLKTADPEKYPYAHKVKIFINPMVPTFITPTEFNRLKTGAPYLDIICPQMGLFQYDFPQEILDELHSLNCEIWGYAGITKGSPPYYSSKLIGWLAMKQGLKGIGFWGYCYPGTPDYDVIYGADEKIPGAGDEPIVTSRRWEAWRDGIDDYDLLEKLKSLAKEGAKQGLNDAKVKEAREIFAQALENVFGNRDNPEVALAEREKIISAIVKLSR